METVSFVKTLAVLCLLTMIFGRFFCGYVCAFGALGDGVQFVSKKVQKKAKKKLPAIPSGVKKWLNRLPFGILTAIILLCALGVYGSLGGYSPWDVFSMATSLKFRLEGYGLGCVLLVLILVGMAWEPRFFCRFLCPMGAVFRLLPISPGRFCAGIEAGAARDAAPARRTARWRFRWAREELHRTVFAAKGAGGFAQGGIFLRERSGWMRTLRLSR